MAFHDPVIQEQFDAYMMAVRAMMFPLMAFATACIGTVLLAWATTSAESGEANGIAAGALGLVGGVIGLVLFAALPRKVAAMRHVLQPAMYAYLLIIAMWGAHVYLRNGNACSGAFYTVLITSLVLLHCLALMTVTIHAPLPLPLLLEALLFLVVLDAYVHIGDAEACEGGGGARGGNRPVAICCALLTTAIIMGMTCVRMDSNCSSFARLLSVQRVRDEAVRVQRLERLQLGSSSCGEFAGEEREHLLRVRAAARVGSPSAQASIVQGAAALFTLLRGAPVRNEAERQKMDYVAQTLHDVRDEAERQKMDYVAQTLHDVGTPLATFALAVENLKSSAPMNQEHLEALRTCDCAIELMTLTRRKAIDYAKHYSGELCCTVELTVRKTTTPGTTAAIDCAKHYSGRELRPRLGSTNVRELVETKCRRIMSGFNSASMVPIAYNVDAGIAKFIVTDGEFVWECLVNYLSNAVKFTNEGAIQCNVYKIRPDCVRFEVRDTGIGIPHARKAQLFKPFSQLQKFAGGTGLGLWSVKKKAQLFKPFSQFGGGTGLGLWSVKKKVTALRGEVGVHDNPGGGSNFFFDIPYKPDFVLETAMEAQAAEAAAAEAAAAAAAPGGDARHTILLVDNRPVTRDTAARLLERQGFVVNFASNGFEGLMKMQRQAYTIVLLDYHVVVMDALQVLQKFRDWECSPSAQRQRTPPPPHPGGAPSGGSGGGSGGRRRRRGSGAAAPPLPEVNAALNGGADAVWTDPVLPAARDLLAMLADEREAQPAAAAAAAAAAAPVAAAAAPSEARRSDGSVLLIEDELSILKFEKRMFELHGFEVDTATNGEEGLQKMKRRAYDAVFTDIVMPVMDGYETVRQFRRWEADAAADAQRGGGARRAKQVVYAVSANASEQDHMMAHAIGMDGFASKPVKVKELVELVRRRPPPHVSAAEAGGSS
ncbi:hypothetical protein JKP88DRAFT_272293 [Tribonema minus]|uniref:histidine kinase n=1 Tax=Tribonema minus TaxID=303371 RepID=A0A835ZFU5_9STRA|nr:hypothetical protein JKP88DRAFT_272293 [Tribonema minus]